MNTVQHAGRVIYRHPIASLSIVLLISLTTALGYTMNALERGLRQAVTRAVDKFDLLVGTPGSSNALLLGTVFLRPQSLGPIPEAQLKRLAADPSIRSIAPLAFGDSTDSGPMVGTSAAFFDRPQQAQPEQGRLFDGPLEAVVGYQVKSALGTTFRPVHDSDDDSQHDVGHALDFLVVGRLKETGTPWDNVTLVPITSLAQLHYRETAQAQALLISTHTIADAYRLRHDLRDAGLMAAFSAELLTELDSLTEGLRTAVHTASFAFQLLVLGGVAIAMTLLVRYADSSHTPPSNASAAPVAHIVYRFGRGWFVSLGLSIAGISLGVVVAYIAVPLLSTLVSKWLGLSIVSSLSISELEAATVQLAVLASTGIVSALAASLKISWGRG
ncbi:hypothetical protein AEM42_12010 [Betaproteobacteria bacterium UKL13-2]|jgi:putative ABC transport system permease protein|nr:hypothetical protein AEM42_12010 [Betaproteobacteria bacterium UKL13-2]HCG52136.1 hypothetical protein [Betaproteobacteria bacterium]